MQTSNSPSASRPLRARLSATLSVLAITLLAGGLASCDMFSKDPATIAGVVLNAETDRAVAGARVEVLDGQGTRTIKETVTDEEGAFTVSIDVDSLSTYRIVASKLGFEAAETSVTIDAEQHFTLRDPLKMAPTGSSAETTGIPRSITLAHRTAQAIGVSGSGAVETATLTFAVLDGNGVPLDAASAVTVRFQMLNQPSPAGAPGAEFLYPSEAQTDENGEAKVTLTAGTRSGPVQIRAEVDGPDGVIRSTPVVTAIHGGLPDQDHFTIAPQQLNFHGRTIYGIENPILVIVGDSYGNPVQSDTEVYFTTTHGVIGGSGATDAMGRTSSILQSADPLPNATGLGTVTARTAGVDGVSIESSTQVVFSGPTQIELEGSGDLESGGINFIYRVTDDLGNPIVGGSTVTVTVEGENVAASGHMNVTIPDARYPGPEVTEFHFRVRMSPADAESASLDHVQIAVSSPNGNRVYSYSVGRAAPSGILTPVEIR
jgi:hypothetical protein